MNEWISEIWPQQWGPWEEYQRPSLTDFVKLTLMHLAPISQAQDCLQRAYTLSREWETIQPEQCNEIISLIKKIDKPVTEYERFLEQKSQMPLALFSLRYPVLIELACIKEHLWMALALLGRYRSLYHIPSNEAARLQFQILGRLEALLRSSQDIVWLSQAMFDQARFQAHRDSTTLSSFPLQFPKQPGIILL